MQNGFKQISIRDIAANQWTHLAGIIDNGAAQLHLMANGDVDVSQDSFAPGGRRFRATRRSRHAHTPGALFMRDTLAVALGGSANGAIFAGSPLAALAAR